MSIKANDTVKVGDEMGKVIKVYDYIAIVEYDDGMLEKVPLNMVEKVEPVKHEPTITRAQFRAAAEKVMDPSLYVSDGGQVTSSHALMALTVDLGCTKLEKILFGSESENA